MCRCDTHKLVENLRESEDLICFDQVDVKVKLLRVGAGGGGESKRKLASDTVTVVVPVVVLVLVALIPRTNAEIKIRAPMTTICREANNNNRSQTDNLI